MPIDHQLYFEDGAQAGATSPYCGVNESGEGKDASSSVSRASGTNWMILCPPVLNREGWSLALHTVKEGDEIDDHGGAMSVTIVHEFGHLLAWGR